MNFTDFKKSLYVPAPKIVFVGLGNKARGDDAAGLLFLHELQRCRDFRGAAFIEAGTNPENVLEPILAHHPEMVIFIDAANVGKAPGDICWIDHDNLDTARISTHAFSVTMVEHYLKAHKTMDIKYLGIRPATTAMGTQLSVKVKSALESFFQL